VPSYRASTLLGREVRFRGIRLGVVADLLVDPPSRRALGYDVVCGDDARRFLPLAACDAVDGAVEVGSALVLLDDPFYRERAQSFAELRGTVVRRGPVEVGMLRDLVVDEDAILVALVIESGGRVAEARLDPALSFGAGALRPAV
jgi:hypothetical protein